MDPNKLHQNSRDRFYRIRKINCEVCLKTQKAIDCPNKLKQSKTTNCIRLLTSNYITKL